MAASLGLVLLLRLALGSAFASQAAAAAKAPPRPNFIVILVDDLDETQDSSGELAMPATKRLLRDRGVTFTNHIVTTPICCPSRVNLLRGQLSHNTNFTDVLGPHGGYAKFRALGLDREWLPTWLQRADYNTLYTGKFIVDYTIRNYDPAPSGWSVFDALVHPFTFEYYSPAFSLNGGKPRMYPAQYSTDVVGAKALAMLRSAATDPAGRPFYLQVAPPAPHHSMHYDFNSSGALLSRHWYPPVPAARHWEELSGAVLPRPPSFNDPWVAGKPSWLRSLPLLTSANATFLEEIHRLRLRCMRAVDELVEATVNELESLGISSRTYLLFTSDNGYHEGVHRMGSGKTTAYEEDIRVPLLMAGPGLVPGSRVGDITAHIDIVPTVLTLAGLPLAPSLDGTPLPLAAVSDGTLPPNYVYGSPDHGPLRNQLVAEFWGEWLEESIHSHPPYPNNTWRAVRVLRSDREEAYKYVLHCSGEFELYDLVRDPYERINLLAPVDGGRGGSIAPWSWGWWAATSSVVSPRAPTRFKPTSSSSSPWGLGGAAAVAEAAAVAARAWAKTAWAAFSTAATRGSESAAAHSSNSRGSPGSVSRIGCDAGGASGGANGGASDEPYRRWLVRIRSRLDALLAVLAVCSGRACSHPFQVLHPEGSVADLWSAMDEQYDDLYDAIPPFSFGRCLPYQDLDNERSAFRGVAVPDCLGQQAPHIETETGTWRARAGVAAVEDPREDLTVAAGARDSSFRQAAAAQSGNTGDIGFGSIRGGGGGSNCGGGSCSEGVGNGSGSGGGGFQLLESDVESAAVPLPAKYLLVTDVYGNTAVQDAMLLA